MVGTLRDDKCDPPAWVQEVVKVCVCVCVYVCGCTHIFFSSPLSFI